MKKLAAKDRTYLGDVRLIPPGKDRLPWFASKKTYPSIGRPSFWEYMTEKERDQLYQIYLDEGLDALHDAVTYLDKRVWLNRYLSGKESAASRGQRLMDNL